MTTADAPVEPAIGIAAVQTSQQSSTPLDRAVAGQAHDDVIFDRHRPPAEHDRSHRPVSIPGQPSGRGEQQVSRPAGRIEVHRFVSGRRAERERRSPAKFRAGKECALLPEVRPLNGCSQFAGRSTVQTAVAP